MMQPSPKDPYGAFLSLVPPAINPGEVTTNPGEVTTARTLGDLSLGIKDNLLTPIGGLPTTCGSRILETYRAPYEATAVTRLRRAGARIVGKTNLDEFSLGSSTEHSAFFPCKNPWDLTRVPGGSSGGSAAAVAAGLCDAALGSDTGGSIRQPAAFCGVTGLKPTYGRVSRHGLVAFASSLDVVGVLARSVATVARILEAIAGPDAHDATCLGTQHTPDAHTWRRACDAPVDGLRLGIIRDLPTTSLEAGVGDAVDSAIAELTRDPGVTRVDINLPHLRHAVATYYLIAMAEVSTNLARFDGVRFGRRATGADTLRALVMESRREGLGDEVKRRILLGTYVLSAGQRDARYVRAQRVRRIIQSELLTAFEGCDAIALPTTPTVAFPLGARLDDPQAMYAADTYTVAPSLAGLPAISLPCGLSKGLPVGLQLMAPPYREDTLLALGGVLQRRTDWHHRQPDTP